MENMQVGKVAVLALLAFGKETEYKESVRAMAAEDTQGAMASELTTGGLKALEVVGFARGVIAALKVLEGGDPFDEFDRYVDSVEETERKALEAQFQMQVERYSETGEA